MGTYSTHVRLLFAALLLNGCASLPTDYPRPHNAALEDTDDTTLGLGASALIDRHPGESGVYLLDKGLDAFAARLRLMDAAERSIDVQYYFIVDDTTGRLFVERLLAAADRGIRVRLLLDDFKTKGHDPGLAALHFHHVNKYGLFGIHSLSGGILR